MPSELPNAKSALTCQQVELFLSEYIEDDPDMAQEQKEAIADHLKHCPECYETFETERDLIAFTREHWDEISGKVPIPSANIDQAVREEKDSLEDVFDVEAGLQDLFRRAPDLAKACQKEMRLKQIGRIICYSGVVAAAACLVIAAFIGWPTSPRRIISRELLHVVPAQPKTSTEPVATSPSVGLEDLEMLRWSGSGATVVSLATLDSKLWRSENREWFSRQFPQIFQIQDFLAKKYAIQADYIELLMVSGDLWQFHYDPKGPIGQRITIYSPSSLNRVAAYYNLPANEIATAVTPHLPASALDVPQTATDNDESALADLQLWAQTIKATINSPKGVPIEKQLSLLQAGNYLGKTRTAAYLWIRENRTTAAQMLTMHYTVENLVGVDIDESIDTWLERLEAQEQASRYVMWSGQRLLGIPITDDCTLLPIEFRTSLVHALDTLTPKNLRISRLQFLYVQGAAS